MNQYIILVVAIVAYFAFKMLTAPKVEKINGDRLDQLLKDKTVKRQFIDVRTQSEFKSNNIKGFKNIPLQSLHSRVTEIDKEKPVVLMCASGQRSMQAARILNKMGVETLINVSGGLSAYRK